MTKKPIASQKAGTAGQKQAAGRTRVARQGARPLRERRSHAQSDLRGNRLALYVGGGLVLLVALLLGIGYYNSYIGPARQAAIQVGPRSLSLGYFRDRLKADAEDNGDATQSAAFSREDTLADTLIGEQLYLQRATQTLRVTASENDIALQMAQLVHAPTQNNKITDQAGYLALVRQQLEHDGLSLSQLRTIALAAALKANALQAYKDAVPKQAPAAQVHELIFKTQAQGQAAQQRLQQGDSFADLEQDSVSDPDLGQAAPLDWTPVGFGLLPDPIDGIAAKLPQGEVSDLLQVAAPSPSSPDSSGADTSSGSTQWMLIDVFATDPNHAVTDAQVTTIANHEQSAWEADQKAALKAQSLLTDTMRAWAATNSGLPQTAPATPTPPSAPATVPGTGPGSAGPVGPPAPSTGPSAPGGSGAPPGGQPPGAPAAPAQPNTVPAVPPANNGAP